MPGRLIPLRTEEFYHVYNRGINRCPTFITKKEYERALLTLHYYQYVNVPVRLSILLSLPRDTRAQALNECHKRNQKMVTLLAFCLMPNHFHLLLQQNKDNGTSTYLGNIQNSYTRYFNEKNNRDGSLFLDQFKAVHIDTNEQLLHVSRYIHLNPFASSLCSLEKTFSYPWSSISAYYENREITWINTDVIKKMFRSKKGYHLFVKDQAGYQKSLHKVSYLLFE